MFVGIEDEVVIEYIFNILETEQKPDPRIMQINLTGFLESKTKVCAFLGVFKAASEYQQDMLNILHIFAVYCSGRCS